MTAREREREREREKERERERERERVREREGEGVSVYVCERGGDRQSQIQKIDYRAVTYSNIIRIKID